MNCIRLMCLMLSSILIFTLGACANNESPFTNATIKILYWDEENFHASYSSLFPADVAVEVVPLRQIYTKDAPPLEELVKLVEREQPDLLFVNELQFGVLQERNYIQHLAIEDQIEAHVIPPVVELLRDQGDGQIKALATTFVSDALYYNKSLFDKYDIPYPSESLNWEEAALLAARFPDEVTALALPASNAASFAVQLGLYEGLTYIVEGKVVLNTDSWRNVIASTRQLSKSLDTGNERMPGEDFLQGEAAMLLADSNYYSTLVNSGDLLADWGVVPAPANDHSQAMLHVNQLLAVNANATNTDLAIRLLTHILDNRTYKQIEMQQGASLSAFKDSRLQAADHPLHFLLSRTANTNASRAYARIEALPDDFKENFGPYFMQMLEMYMRDEMGLEEALITIEHYGNQLLSASAAFTEAD